ncbi:putative PYRUVATE DEHYDROGENASE E1 COMPONENT,ALPHA SUBUNIT [Vibrio nigripulchritudo SFn27]|uniref:Putative PYRUVATE DEHYDROGENASE E1 COMPONENT, ALPHA SUBUNIT n=1 Tax=Vibrio nigripulchritudo TaxID=28173 RepID=U4KCZ5_9VIBR|nr:thiamine pyrophosphate-dependent dehydrogenase E1 component subunit alpha [Vibrio nigripulchritudo]CCN83179.1 putative PYRUVATE DEHYDROGENASE E1 COMPONENT,ALPHA SUBUNIT [Vibrio nigripulchritudo BLFn1]CCN88638.1 putative PYRUVATE DEHYDROGENASE E1 COMPONENT,ALPHA SUBUNIT [Vibrio nigripulchritudo SFn27]CCN92777.1 putative PYRUVATE DEHYDROGENASE E1 COMPONENT,ALPHA SUBUNIT [Vibrio nigripulchritudo ENn2]CCO40363.1 putative PYRUVATE DEHYDROGENASE E1 COMPONENT,ALPHA SUBUNIT [Vibrio nigripulchritudo 
MDATKIQAETQVSSETLKKIFTSCYKTRLFETEGIRLYRQGHVRGYFHPYLGQEGIAAGACAAADQSIDFIASTHRGHGHCISWGADVKRMLSELLQKKEGYCKGYGGSMHIADIQSNNLGANGIVGAGTPIGVGSALANQVKDSDAVTIVFTSDGGVNNGTFLEALNLAAIWNLNVVLIIENNQYAVSTPIEESTRQTELYRRGESIGVPSYLVDGNDPLAVYERVSEACDLCRAGKGPVLIEAKTYRHSGHHVNDPGTYMPENKLQYYKDRDPVISARDNLRTLGGYTEEQVTALEEQIESELEEALAFALAGTQVSVEEFKQAIEDY